MRLFEIDDPTDLLTKYKDHVDFAIDKFNQGIAIYRGSKTYTQNVRYADPSSWPTARKSKDTHNYYTLWMDNNPEWAEYPKRSRSLICSTYQETTEIFGKPMVVVPLTNCKIGICPNVDLWCSFKGVQSLKDFNYWLHDCFKEQWPNEDNRNINYQELLQKLKEITTNTAGYSYSNLRTVLQKQGNAEGVMREILDPVKNNFKLTTWQQFEELQDTDREVWLSAPCLLINPLAFKILVKRNKSNEIV